MNNKKIYKKLIKIISRYTNIKRNKIKLNTHLRNELNLSSFDFVSIIVDIETEFCIELDDLDEFININTVDDIVSIIYKHINYT